MAIFCIVTAFESDLNCGWIDFGLTEMHGGRQITNLTYRCASKSFIPLPISMFWLSHIWSSENIVMYLL